MEIGSVMEIGMLKWWKLFERYTQWLGRLPGGRLCASSAANTSPDKRTAAQRQGALWERRAQAHLERHGLRLLAANFRCSGGEIDLIMQDGAVVVFVEGRQRASASHGGAAASVTIHKQRRLLRAAHAWLSRYRRLPPCRIDVVAIDGDQVDWLRDAVQAPN
jgi:putative endonuclease